MSFEQKIKKFFQYSVKNNAEYFAHLMKDFPLYHEALINFVKESKELEMQCSTFHFILIGIDKSLHSKKQEFLQCLLDMLIEQEKDKEFLIGINDLKLSENTRIIFNFHVISEFIEKENKDDMIVVKKINKI